MPMYYALLVLLPPHLLLYSVLSTWCLDRVFYCHLIPGHEQINLELEAAPHVSFARNFLPSFAIPKNSVTWQECVHNLEELWWEYK